ncbi:tRNA (adenosine(37)-N6)-threonylcarbamoyltransferase complex ATPase subunit type 1 TsaE [Synergistales bacterium]|nr:tRNA (adenosine(37)-N6)-threonylcarbamoyltransferase complex ATPase subunit type 1 TsaE [Synergistales bacterium]
MTPEQPDIEGKLPAIESNSPRYTEKIGAILAPRIFSGLLVLLCGNLGAGKTLLARSMGESLGAKKMRSPTFAIESIHEPEGALFPISHFDLYRLGDISETRASVEERISDGYAVFAEWGEMLGEQISGDIWRIDISENDDESRVIELSASGFSALGALASAYEKILDMPEEERFA